MQLQHLPMDAPGSWTQREHAQLVLSLSECSAALEHANSVLSSVTAAFASGVGGAVLRACSVGQAEGLCALCTRKSTAFSACPGSSWHPFITGTHRYVSCPLLGIVLQ